ncbi:MAG: DUF4956 domain-containing protein [Actinobacteria bacterium]|nr:DUF4956 domain-containing protein [Actinomycetota bacterium]
MLDSAFSTILDVTGSTAAAVSMSDFLLCSLISLVLGSIIALVYMFRQDHSKNFVVTLALLPLIVQAVITLVNGNLGAGIAVMGVFNLVRFRSIPGSAKDIGSVFFAMAVGLATGMGYLTMAVVFTAIVSAANIAYSLSPFGKQKEIGEKSLKVTIPEDLDYCDIFDDIFARYTSSSELMQVKTTNMGSLYQLEYHIRLKDSKTEKRFIDEIRCRNGNLSIVCGRMVAVREVL